MKKAKEPHLLERVRKCVESGNYLDTAHSSIRRDERRITRPEFLYVLKHGWHEKAKDQFDEFYKAWNYAIRGETIDGRELRVVVAFERQGILVITAIELKD